VRVPVKLPKVLKPGTNMAPIRRELRPTGERVRLPTAANVPSLARRAFLRGSGPAAALSAAEYPVLAFRDWSQVGVEPLQ